MKFFSPFFFIFLFGCSSIFEDDSIKISYYHWKTKVSIEQSWFQQYNPSQMYVKMLDLSYKEQIDIVVSQMSSSFPVPVIPVIYIDYRLLKEESPIAISEIIRSKISPQEYTIIQLDCDWTPTTRKVFFELVEILNQHYQETTATIRLHQVKYYKKTGVPPVKRGVLMYYNMSDLKDPTTQNYILDLEVAQRYHYNFDTYPLSLDLALPIYKQGRVIRKGIFVALLQFDELDQTNLRALSGPKDQIYIVTKSHYLGGRYLYKNDILKIDDITLSDLQNAAQGLKDILQPNEVIFYEQQYAKDFGQEVLESVGNIFKK